jgi:hypothetical protein
VSCPTEILIPGGNNETQRRASVHSIPHPHLETLQRDLEQEPPEGIDISPLHGNRRKGDLTGPRKNAIESEGDDWYAGVVGTTTGVKHGETGLGLDDR